MTTEALHPSFALTAWLSIYILSAHFHPLNFESNNPAVSSLFLNCSWVVADSAVSFLVVHNCPYVGAWTLHTSDLPS